jgi:ATP-dependent RNA helicase DDX49/DBP8
VQGCHLLSVLLEELGVSAAALHSHKPQRARLAALDRFKSGAVPLLLATDVASRGLDIPTVDLVVNYDLPQLARDYVHRWGPGLASPVDGNLGGRDPMRGQGRG